MGKDYGYDPCGFCRRKRHKKPALLNCEMVAAELDDIGRRANQLVIDAYEFERSALVLCYPKTCKATIYDVGLIDKRIQIVLDTIEVLTFRLFALADAVQDSCSKKLDICYEGYSCRVIAKKIEALGYEADKIFRMVKALLKRVKREEADPCEVAKATAAIVEAGRAFVIDIMELATEVRLSCRCGPECWVQ